MTGDDTEKNVRIAPVRLIGRLKGLLALLMNEEREHAAFEALAPFPGEGFLVMGPGSGYCVREILSVPGIGPVRIVTGKPWQNSVVADQNRAFFTQGNLRIIPPDALNSDRYNRFFDAILSIDDLKKWPIISAELLEIRRLLRPSGRLLMVWTIRSNLDHDLLLTLLAALPEAGYLTIRQKRIPTRPVSCFIVEARRNG